MEFVLPVLILAGLAGLMFDFGDDNAASGDSVASDGDNGDQADNPEPRNLNFMRLDATEDTATGTDGDDAIRAGDGHDTVSGGAGDDRIFLEGGKDVYTGEGGGNDLVRGGSSDDEIRDFLGSDTLFGDLGADRLSALDARDADHAPDTLFGGYGADALEFDAGDTASGGVGDDSFLIRFDGGAPSTITDYEAGEMITLQVPAIFESDAVTVETSDDGTDSQILVDNQTAVILKGVIDPTQVLLHVTSDAEVTGQGTSSTFSVGDASAETFRGSADSDITLAGESNDKVFGNAGNDLLFGGDGDDFVDGGAGNDIIQGGLGADVLRGGAGDDTITDNAGQTTVQAGSGNDIVDVRDAFATNPVGADDVALGEGDDVVLLDDGDTVRLGAGADMAIISIEDVTDSPVTIRDYDPDEDALEIRVGDGSGTLALTPLADNAGTSVAVDGQEIAILNNILLNSPSSITIVRAQPEEFF